MAQTEKIKRDTVVTYEGDRYRVSTNRFFDNWFINAGAGGQLYFGDHNKQMKFSEQLTPNFEFNIGKWFTPGIGTRVGVNGFKVKGVTQNGSHSTDERYEGQPWEGYWLTNQEFNYFHLHGDVLFNLANMIGGYQADRFDGETGGRRNEGVSSAYLGLAYQFPKRGWDKNKTTTISYDEALLNQLREQVAQLAADNDALRKQLAEAEGDTITDIKITDIKVEQRLLAAPILVTFPINKSVVSNEARVNLGFFAKVIKEGDNDVVYNVTGYADKGTGTPAINERLSKARAEAIYQVLVNEFGVPVSQLEVSHEGRVDNMFYDDPRLSRAVITIAK